MTNTDIERLIKPILKARGIVRAGFSDRCYASGRKRRGHLDVFIETNGKMDLFEFMNTEDALSEKIGRKVDLVTYAVLVPEVKKRVELEEVRVL